MIAQGTKGNGDPVSRRGVDVNWRHPSHQTRVVATKKIARVGVNWEFHGVEGPKNRHHEDNKSVKELNRGESTDRYRGSSSHAELRLIEKRWKETGERKGGKPRPPGRGPLRTRLRKLPASRDKTELPKPGVGVGRGRRMMRD